MPFPLIILHGFLLLFLFFFIGGTLRLWIVGGSTVRVPCKTFACILLFFFLYIYIIQSVFLLHRHDVTVPNIIPVIICKTNTC